MFKFPAFGALAAATLLSACATGPDPVEVTRFSAPERLNALGTGTISVEAAPGEDAGSLELRGYQVAVSRELTQLGYREVAAGTGQQVAEVRVDRGLWREGERRRGPVSVGVGGSTGSYGSGVGVGVGVNLGSLGGGSKDRVGTQLSVVIRDRSTGLAIWEGRAEQVVKAGSPLADPQAASSRLADALFANFPGESGETVEVD